MHDIQPFDRKAFVEHRMKMYRAYAQCQCAAHTLKAMQDAEASADGIEQMEAFFKTPEGIALREDVSKQLGKIGETK